MAPEDAQDSAAGWCIQSGREEDARELLTFLGRGHLPAGFRIIKENRRRTLYRGILPGAERSVILKHYRHSALLERLASLFRLMPGRAEWQASALLTGRGIPTPRRLAYGARHGMGMVIDEIFVADDIPDTETALDYSRSGESRRPPLFRGLGRLLRSLHDGGIYHPDLHLGNILVSAGAEKLSFHVIDLHAIRPLTGVNPRTALANLAHVRNSLSESEQDGFPHVLDGYFEIGDSPFLERRNAGDDVEVLARARRRLRFRSRQNRCLRNSTEFRITRIDGAQIHHRAELDPAEILKAYDQFRRPEDDHPLLKDDRPARLKAGYSVGSRSFVIKEYTPRGLTQSLKALAGRSRSRLAYERGNGLRVRGIPGAEPMAWIRPRGLFSLAPSAVFLEDLTAFDEADRYAVKVLDSPVRRRDFARALGRAVGRLHGQGVLPDDLKACNLIVGPEETVRLVDHDGISFPDRLTFAQRVRALAQLNNSVPRDFTRSERLRFLKAYARAQAPEHAVDVKGLFRAVWARAKARPLLWVGPSGEDVSASW